eukprot:TRINITY_DN7547_c0_g1_i2.p1 TRINITY_DN7547_c0_g1~~TRINITY_DN7547_c0_g1_i2.p1  ORF type:complete len:355 (-),score=38.82 TRINITY_DN7547_c0_g1_i2:32-1096(-)
MGIASSSQSTSLPSSSSSSTAPFDVVNSTTANPLGGSHHMHLFHILVSDYIPQGSDWMSLSLVCKYISSSIMNSLISEHMTFKVRDCRFTWYKPTKIRVKRSRLSSLTSPWSSSSSMSIPIPCHVTSLILDGSGFKSPIPGLPPSLLSLELRHKYNRPLPMLPTSLERLKMESYNHPLILPMKSRLKYLFCGSKYNHPLPLLPHSLCVLHLGKYSHPLLPSHLPPNLKKLHLGLKYNHPLPPVLPSSLIYLHLGFKYNHPLPSSMPPSLICLCLGNFNHPLPSLPTTLVHLYAGFPFSHPLPSPLPLDLKYLILSFKFKHPIPEPVPLNLEFLQLFGYHPLPTSLPTHTKVVYL